MTEPHSPADLQPEPGGTPNFQVGTSDLRSKGRRQRKPPAPKHPVPDPATHDAAPSTGATIHPLPTATQAPPKTEPEAIPQPATSPDLLDQARAVADVLRAKADDLAAPTDVEDDAARTASDDKSGRQDEEAVDLAPAPPEPPAALEDPTPMESAPATTVDSPAATSENPAPVTDSGTGVAEEAEVPWEKPVFKLDPKDPASRHIKGTTSKVPVSIMRRFNTARRSAPSHTAILVDAVRKHADSLPQLILRQRPEISRPDLDDPLRHITFDSESKDDLRIRPTLLELQYFKALVESINVWLEANWPSSRPTNQSEIFAVMLDADLPTPKKRKPQK
ncbi:hypothetical protein AB0N05_37815 [Nocardia sp. NPDC051030]|uniref:hypothetical protein n=1 Tax=Nocardia sp. NPDC051030 TaxID=3155162 RepID=UPI003418312A